MKNTQQYGHQLYKNFSSDEKQRLAEYRKKYYKMRKKCCIITTRNYSNLENLASLWRELQEICDFQALQVTS